MILKYKKIKMILVSLTLLLSACAMVNNPNTNDNSSNDKKVVSANADIQLGMLFLGKGDVLSAKQKFLSALHLAPNYSPAWYSMGYYLEVTGDNKQANKYYLIAVNL